MAPLACQCPESLQCSQHVLPPIHTGKRAHVEHEVAIVVFEHQERRQRPSLRVPRCAVAPLRVKLPSPQQCSCGTPLRHCSTKLKRDRSDGRRRAKPCTLSKNGVRFLRDNNQVIEITTKTCERRLEPYVRRVVAIPRPTSDTDYDGGKILWGKRHGCTIAQSILSSYGPSRSCDDEDTPKI